MPVTKSAKKALRQSRRKKGENEKRKKNMRAAIKTFRAKPSKQTLARVFSALDCAVDSKTIHKNRAARLKSRLARLLAK